MLAKQSQGETNDEIPEKAGRGLPKVCASFNLIIDDLHVRLTFYLGKTNQIFYYI